MTTVVQGISAHVSYDFPSLLWGGYPQASKVQRERDTHFLASIMILFMKGVLTARINSCQTLTVWPFRGENSRPALLAAVEHHPAVRRVQVQVQSTQPTLSYL